METGPDDSIRLDPVLIGLSALMAIHCMVARWLPPALAGKTAHAISAALLIGASLSVLVGGWMKHHELRVFGWGATGWLGLVIARVDGGASLNESAEVILTCASCGLLVLAHALNRSLLYWRDRS